MIDNHPITPPPELVNQWCNEGGSSGITSPHWFQIVATQAARWGADQELEACCEVLARELICDGKHVAIDLRKHRRSKPPSLKEEALEALKHAEKGWRPVPADCEIIRRALESLPN